VTDSQEYPLADLAVCFAVASVVRLFTEGELLDCASQKTWSVARLYRLFFDAVHDAERAIVLDPEYAAIFGLGEGATFGDIWKTLLSRPGMRGTVFEPWYAIYRRHGTLARRMLARAGIRPARAALRALADELCACLAENRPFI